MDNKIGNGEVELTKIAFHPNDSVEFVLDKNDQRTELVITNNEMKDVTVKWKANASIYSASPRYGIIKSQSSKKFILTCKGVLEKNYKKDIPVDRFTVVLTAIKTTEKTASQIWKNAELQEKLFQGKLHKKYIFVVYKDRNLPNWWNMRKGVLLETPTITYGVVEEDVEDFFTMKTARVRLQEIVVPLESGAKGSGEMRDPSHEENQE